ncbi:MAG: endonuclease domain-containing protein [Clostridia bacterium]|nr:endonuclease domain-containing protein [Clostridia bacterium]
MLPYNKNNIKKARGLRKSATPFENKLWYEFLNTYPIRFQRQKAIGNYIADFYCAKAGLIIELDGGGHYNVQSAQRDIKRTADLEKMNLKVIRFSNIDINKHFQEVCENIDSAVQERIKLRK